MKLLKLIFFLLFLLNVTTLAAQAQLFHYFDHQSLTVIQGQILNIGIEEVYGKRSEFLMLSVQSDDQRLFRVEVCPQWFFVSAFTVGMNIRIRGSLLPTSTGTFYLIAQEISLPGKRITLRDSKGFPLWSRRGGGRHRDRQGPEGRGKK